MTPSDLLMLIPARRNSKRLSNKNLRTINNVSLWEMAYRQALSAWSYLPGKVVIMVSTDIEEIESSLASGHFYRRPDALCGDDATSEQVALDALKYYPADMVCLLQPTSPLRNELDIIRCIMQCPAYTIGGEEPTKPNGAVYCMFRDDLENVEQFSSQRFNQVEMPDDRSIDIDTEEDLEECRRRLNHEDP